MSITHTVTIHRPDHPPVRIGPFIARTNADRFADRLQGILRKSATADAVVEVGDADPDQQHLNPRLPTDPWSLGDLAEQERDEDFPGLFTRLCAQLGQEVAEEIWDRATDWTSADSPAEERKRAELTAAAEEWRSRREESTSALGRIAVELWHGGLHNVRRIGQITGLSRTTLYAALRDAGVEPTDRRADDMKEN